MKVKIGTIVKSDDYGSGMVVAMSQEWCIFKNIEDENEYALLWDEVYIPIDRPSSPASKITKKEIEP